MTWQKLSSLPGQKIIGKYAIEYWAIREGKVWHQGRKLAAADAATFEVFDGGEDPRFIARDAASIFHAWSRLPQIDRGSFRKNGAYWQDKDRVYFEYETSLKPIQNADAKQFRDLGHGYGADEKSAWYCGRQMKHCTRGGSLRTMPENGLYASDGEQVYCDGKLLKGAIAGQWRILNSDYFSGDGKSVWYMERKLPRVDIPSWRHVYRTWSKDRHHVFRMNLIEKDVAPDTFDAAQARAMNANRNP